jgi:translation initiation factor IF-3
VSLNNAVNDQIRAKEVRLIAESGEQVGIISYAEAQRRADQAGLDLVAINESNGIPVCKLLDWGKFKYEQARKDRESAKKSRESRVELKEIQLRPTTDTNDIHIKAKRAQAFLEEGNKVKVVMRFKGREISHINLGASVIQSFLDCLTDYKFERPIQRSDRQLFAIVMPAPKGTTGIQAKTVAS